MTTHRVALVTGSGKKRLGWHIAQALAGRGYALALHYHHSTQEAHDSAATLQARGTAVLCVQADVSDEGAVEAMVRQVVSHFGRLDVLVNGAGVWPARRLEETTAEDVRRAFEANTLGTFLCARAAGLVMVGQPEGGCIINLGDWAVKRPYLDHAAYFVSKGALSTLTRCLAVELGTRNPRVRVSCIHPGPVMLPPDLPAQERQEAISATLVRHEGNPHNVAQAVLALVENDFITGASLPVDGGRTIYARGL
jgi:pteridine reductase